MDRHIPRDHATSNVLAWTATQSANVEPSVEEEAGADADEPPDHRVPDSPIQKHFTRNPIRRGSEQHESLLTKALQSHSDEDSGSGRTTWRRRSITSNISLASTVDWTCDTGITTPARTSSPSPRMPDASFALVDRNATKAIATPAENDKGTPLQGSVHPPKDPAVQALEKKRCISFACAARPKPEAQPPVPSPSRPVVDGAKAPEPQKRISIKFACSQPPPRPAASTQADLEAATPVSRAPVSTLSEEGTPRPPKPQSPSAVRSHSGTPRRSSRSPVATRCKKYITANPGDLESECARFHEFASGEPQEDDWIRRDDPSSKPKLTINDTLSKENAIRKLGKEAEEEAELEEEEEEEEEDEDEDDNEDEEESDEEIDETLDDEDDLDDAEDGDDDGLSDFGSKQDWDYEASDGYNTDNEVGFAESDDEDDDLVLWTTNGARPLSLSGATPVCRRQSVDGQSESSGCSRRNSRYRRGKGHARASAAVLPPGTPELPDSTDFVCGTLDEDRPLEEAYISRVAARRRDKLQPIPQDIDPSFPTSEPEDDEDLLYRKGYGDSDDHLWLHGEIEDLHHEHDRKGRKKKSDNQSPKRCRSPPPKRRPSPAPQARGRLDKRLFDRSSPRRPRSPAPRPVFSASPAVSPVQTGEGIAFKSLAFRPGLTHTKSLPRAPDMFHHLKSRKAKAETEKDAHVRGAIDIVKGLEQKRQRRKEKYYQKYCSRARKEKAQVKRPPPGQGAQRMREVGLIMAGKIGQGNYVLSI